MVAEPIADMVPGLDELDEDAYDHEIAEQYAHVPHVERYIREGRARIEILRKQALEVSDRDTVNKLRGEISMIQRVLEWLPDALQIPAIPVTFGSANYCRGKIWMPAFLREQDDEWTPQSIQLRGYKYTTNNPIEIARMRVHIASGAEPLIEEIPAMHADLDVVPLRVQDQFVVWTPRDSYQDARERGIADPLRY